VVASVHRSQRRRDAAGVWRLPQFRYIFTARVASVAGDWVYQIALTWLVLEVTNSPLALSVVALAQVIPLIAVSALFSGRLTRVVSPAGLAGIDLLHTLVVLAFPVLYWTGQLTLAWFVAISILSTVLDSVFDPGLQALVPQLTHRSAIPAVHSLFDLTRRLGRILGPGLTSLLLLLMPVVGLFLVDAASFVTSALCLVLAGRILSRRRANESTGPDAAADLSTSDTPRPSWRSTFRYLRQSPILLWLFTVRNAQNLLWSVYLIGVPVLVRNDYHHGPGVWGILIAVYAAGQLVGNFITTRRRGYRSVIRYLLAGWLVAGLGFVGLGVLPGPVLGGACLLIGGAGSAAANISSDSYVGIAVPVAVQPAAFSWQFTGNQITQLVGTAALGLILTTVPAGTVVLATGLAMVAVTGAAALAQRRWRIRQSTV
jgi:DHA3 family macrolide efflux protein-like MFS transporter